MTIIRGPQPRENFQVLPHGTARDRRLSFRARGLLVLMLSYPENWRFNREWLADQSVTEGVDAVRTALTELERAGYLRRRRVATEGGKFGWVQEVYRTPPDESPAQTIGGFTTDGKPSNGYPPVVNPPSQEELRKKDLEEDAMSCPGDSVAAGERDKTFDPSWRDEDRALFRELIGEMVRSDGTKWREGVFAADAFYDAFRKGRNHKWPGRRLQKIFDDVGFDDWLIDEGLERA